MVISKIAKGISKIAKKQNGATDQGRKARADRNLNDMAKFMLQGKPSSRKELAEMKNALKSAFKQTKKELDAKKRKNGKVNKK
jgi:hypothetical protein